MRERFHSLSKQWKVRSPDQKTVEKLTQELSIHPALAQILVNRGITESDEANRFLNPTLENLANPFLLKDIEKALVRIEQAILQKESIVVYGDYDVDGTTGSALLYLFLKELGASVEVYIPHRVKEGYGLNIDALKKLREQNAKLIITVDNGITAVEESKVASQLGLDLIIIDHHQVPSVLPEAIAILNPKQSACAYPYKELAAVGVAFQVILACRNYLRQKEFFKNRPEPNLKRYLDLVALGTIADVVPLTGQNRILVKIGLEVLSTSENLGVIALKEVSQLSGSITPGQVGFRLGPRINAAGRLHSARLGFELLTSTDSLRAKELAEQLNEANQDRQKLEEETLKHAFEKIDQDPLFKNRRSIFVFHSEWHMGVIGIVASRLVEKYHLPVIVGTIEGNSIRCSARSISGLNLYQTLKACESSLERFGGHSHAAGLVVPLRKAEEFWAQFDEKVRETLSEKDFIPTLSADSFIEGVINDHFVEELQKLSPFGQGNPEPVFWIKNSEMIEKRIIGNNHLKLKMKVKNCLLEAIGFGMGDAELTPYSSLELVFSCQFNDWQGNRKIQLKLVDIPRISR